MRRALDSMDLGNSAKLTYVRMLSNFWGSYSDVHLRGADHDDREMGATAGTASSVRRARGV